MKKLICAALAMLLLTASLASCELKSENEIKTEETENDAVENLFEYENNISGITIKKYIGTDPYVIIPGKIDKKRVTSVADNTFTGCDIVEVYVASTVTEITELAFKDCDSLKRVIFEGDAPENYKSTPVYSREGNYFVYFNADAKGAPSFDKEGWGGEWCGYYARLYDYSAFSMPFGDAFEGESALSSDQLKEIIEKVPSDRYEQYPGLQNKPISATLYVNGLPTNIDINDPRLVKMINLFGNTIYHQQYSYTTGSFDMEELSEFENDPNRLVLKYDIPANEGENGKTRDGYDTIIINTKFFVCINHDIPFGGDDFPVYPCSTFGRWPYYNDYNWLDLFGF